MSRPFSTRTRLLLALLWLALLGLAAWAISQRLELSGDLRKFMPAQVEPDAPPHLEAARAADASRATVRCA